MLKIYLLSALLLGAARVASAQTLDPTFTPPAGVYMPGTIYRLGLQQPDGKRVVTGTFQRLSGMPTAQLARLQADGTLDQAFTQNLGSVTDLLGFEPGTTTSTCFSLTRS